MVPGYMDDVFRMTGDHQIFVCRDHPHRHGAAPGTDLRPACAVACLLARNGDGDPNAITYRHGPLKIPGLAKITRARTSQLVPQQHAAHHCPPPPWRTSL